MQKRWFLAGMIFMLLPLVLVGCGIAQEQYDAVVSELSSARQELQSVKAEMATAQASVADLTADLDSTRVELEAGQDRISELASDLGKTETGLEAAKAESSKMTSSLEKSQGELETAKSEYDSFKTETNKQWSSLDKYLELNHYILGINAGLMREDLDEVHEACSKVSARLETLGDADLLALWEQAYVVDGAQWNLYFEPYCVFMERHALRISTKARMIRNELAE